MKVQFKDLETSSNYNLKMGYVFQIGTHLIASLGNAIYDLDYKTGYATRANLPLQTEIGPLTYFDQDNSPRYMYTWYDQRIRKYKLLSETCDSRLQVRQATYPLYSWLRTGGHGCQDVETHQIDSEIDVSVPPDSGGMW